MQVQIWEVKNMLSQFQRAATSTREKCQNNPEDGYEVRRADDVAHAEGRLKAVSFMQEKLVELTGTRTVKEYIDTQAFKDSFKQEYEAVEIDFKNPKSKNFHLLFGQVEAYSDVISALESWESLPAPDVLK